MHITFLAPVPDMSGGARVIHIYASLLQARGHQVSLIVRPLRPITFREKLRALVRGRPIPSNKGKSSHYDGKNYTLKMLDSFRPIVENDVPDADVIIATWWETAEWMMKMSPRKGEKVHFVQHYEAFEYMPKDRVDAVLSAPTAKITISNWLFHMLRDDFKNEHVALIPNGVDMEQFNASPRHRQSVPTIGMLYSTVGWKNCREGFAAFEDFKKRHPTARLITFGSVKESPQLPLPDGSTHHTLPAQNEIKNIYASCDVWVCPSTAEGFHLPPLEAMACRCPVVSTPVGGPADIIEEGKNGFLVPFNDPTKMSDRLQQIFAMPESGWKMLSDNAYETARRHNWDDATNRFESVLSDIARSGSQSR